MKLYVVMVYWIEDVYLRGVFSTREKAEEVVPKEPQPYCTYEITEIELDKALE